MNCKPGDLAVLVKSFVNNEGRIFRCIRLASEREVKANCFWVYPNAWVIDTPLLTNTGNFVAMAYDQHMRPIRDPGEDAQDESHAWLPPVPTKEHA